MRRISEAELKRVVAQYRRQLDMTNGNLERALAQLGSAVDRGIIRELLRLEGVMDQRKVAEAQTVFRRILDQSNGEFARIARETVPDVMETTLARSAASARLVLGGTQLRRVLTVYEQLEQGMAQGRLLRTAEYELGIWGAEWNDRMMKTFRSVNARVFEAAVRGQSSSNLAKGLAGDLSALNLQDRINPEAFAQSFARTKINELNNVAGVEIAHEAGMDLYVNVGVPDERQSEICYRASQENAHTLEWWEQSEYGRPPRHYNY